MMKLTFKQHYKSIKGITTTEVNNFMVLVGLNGAGKTHLLEGIAKGSILVDSFQPKDISYFNFQTFLIKNQKAITPRNIDDEKLGARQTLSVDKEQIKIYDQQIKTIVGSDTSFPYTIDVPSAQKQAYDQAISRLMQKIDARTRNNPRQRKLILTGILDSGKFVSELSQHDFMFYANYNLDDYELLENLSEIFVDYQRKIVIGGLSKKDGGGGLNDSDIEHLKKNSPWNFLNNMLSEFGFLHKVTSPNFSVADLLNNPSISFQVKLTLDGDGLNFEDLSSGEKILCALAITVYQDQKSQFPSLLLLDEVDASLHPSMIKNLLDVIEKIFLKNGCKVILATHSPTTVALAPEESIYEISKQDGGKTITKISQPKAIDMLSEGYMTFSEGLKITNNIDHTKKLQIISEGHNIRHIKKAIEILDSSLLSQIKFIEGAEGVTSKQQLKNAYEIMKFSLNNGQYLFVRDCDAQNIVNPLTESDHIKKFCFSENPENTKCIKDNKHAGVEDLYSDNFFTDEVYDQMEEKISYGGSAIKRTFSKSKFLDKIEATNDKNIFKNFQPLLELIKDLLQ